MRSNQFKPKLRNVTVQRVTHQGEPVFLIQDGLKLSDAVIMLPQILGPVAMLCDGQRTLPEMQTTLEMQYGLQLSQALLENLVDQFDEALLLESKNFDDAKQRAVERYRAEPFRKPALAGLSYPADPDALRQTLRNYLDTVTDGPVMPATSRGVVSPHIDYSRGGSVYAQLWAGVENAIREAELIIVLGTDHNGGLGTLTLTPQNYASPLGVMPTDQKLVDRLGQLLGAERAFAEELHHQGEHSIELVLVWLQYMRGEKPCPVAPILVGSFHHFMLGEATIQSEPQYDEFVHVLKDEMEKRRTVIVASGDLAHLGPAFGELPLDAAAQAQMEADDQALLNNLCQGDAAAFFDFMQAGQYKRNVCGLSPFYFTLSILGQTAGQTIAYDRCPADINNSSFVSVCGLVWE